MIRRLVKNSFKSIDEGLYDIRDIDYSHEPLKLKKNILDIKTKNKIPLITEIKFSSPSKGVIMNRDNVDLLRISREMTEGGAAGLSVLTQKYLFNGSLSNFIMIRQDTSIPMLMKDIIVSEIQLECAKKIGADYILLIMSIFDKNLAEADLDRFVNYAHKKDLNILFEVHHEHEFNEILKFNLGKEDLIGINNRNLENLTIDLQITEKLLKKFNKGKNVIISESGITNSNQIKQLRNAGADAFLIGTSIMENNKQIATKIKELVNPIQ
ncbi:MAG TPA: indole-3-glycerol-phosphate synthase [Nitrososphaeraceae archaeon]|nr:indole-3-glycerol-phosphate synthase [Nitrososphaeraceae archaeon]